MDECYDALNYGVMCSPTWETHILPGKHISLVICVPPPVKDISLVLCVPLPGKHISLVICFPPPGKHICLVICVPLPGKHISPVICVPLPAKHISLVICLPLPRRHISLVICVPLPGKHIYPVICVPLPGKHIPLVICFPLLGKHTSLVICVPRPGNTNRTCLGKDQVVASCVNTDFLLDQITRESRHTRELLLTAQQVFLGPVKRASCTDFVPKSRTTLYRRFLQQIFATCLTWGVANKNCFFESGCCIRTLGKQN